jgi:protein-L-isoaspartate(D-aspartate) O-methyltransferase
MDFIPDVIWTPGPGGWRVPVSRALDPGRWRELVDTDEPIVTQVDDGHIADGKGFQPTSSSSGIPAMALMLELLHAAPNLNVLEIGTGTGYNAALLARAVAPGHVTTVEIDPTIADHARAALCESTLPVTVLTGDGTAGHPQNAPYDRVIATASARQVPYSWIAQTRPGGRVVLPFATSFRVQAFVSLVVGHNNAAQGPFQGCASFMRLRDQRQGPDLARLRNLDDAAVDTTDAYHPEVVTDFDTAFAMSMRLPDWDVSHRPESGGPTLRLSHRASGSWATIFSSDTGSHTVAYEGPRHLWEDLHLAYRWWLDAGQPEHTRFGLTVAPEGQTFWLDSPDSPLPPIGEPAG